MMVVGWCGAGSVDNKVCGRWRMETEEGWLESYPRLCMSVGTSQFRKEEEEEDKQQASIPPADTQDIKKATPLLTYSLTPFIPHRNPPSLRLLLRSLFPTCVRASAPACPIQPTIQPTNQQFCSPYPPRLPADAERWMEAFPRGPQWTGLD
ncbi:hypothetical protein BKA81DRAFT_189841 [Phyllosticta paracitricarpa]